jgi:hypothetical protein
MGVPMRTVAMVVDAVIMIVDRVAVIVVVHQLLGYIRKHLARRERRSSGPLDAALFTGSGHQIVP